MSIKYCIYRALKQQGKKILNVCRMCLLCQEECNNGNGSGKNNASKSIQLVGKRNRLRTKPQFTSTQKIITFYSDETSALIVIAISRSLRN